MPALSAIIIGLIAPGDAVSFSNGGQCPEPPDGTCKPSVVIQQSLVDFHQGNNAARERHHLGDQRHPADRQRGEHVVARPEPATYNQIKPDIAAPGASLSAEVGTGKGETPFSGTSGAAPMVAGAVALMLEAYPQRPRGPSSPC